MPSSMTLRNLAALCITILGCAAMIGDLVGSLTLKGLGAASTFAPFPKVFCDNQGLEGFASNFTIVAHGPGGETLIPLTSELYARMDGPYNRRNVYGAVFSFGPKLPPEMWRSVFEHALGTDGTLRAEFNVPPDATNVAVRIHTKTRGRADQWTLENP